MNNNNNDAFFSWVAMHTNRANAYESKRLRGNYVMYQREGLTEAAETTKRMLEKFLLSGLRSIRQMIGGDLYTPMIPQFIIWEESQKRLILKQK